MMSRIRIIKGKLIEIVGGDYNIYSASSIVDNAAGEIIEVGVEKGVSYGSPKSPPESPMVWKPDKKHFTCIKKPTPYPNDYGNCNYYKWRFENFLERHQNCPHLPPSYYFGPMQTKSNNTTYLEDKKDMVRNWWSTIVNTEPLKPPYPKYEKGTPIVRESYGYKYCVISSNYLTPKLSMKGKIWLKKAREYLQEYMEKGLDKEVFTSKYNKRFNKKVAQITLKNVELNEDWFQEFAFATHPDAYLDAGIINLPLEDKIEIGLTPDLKEWMSTGTWEQAWYVGKEQLRKWKDDTSESIKQKYEEAKRFYERKKRQLGDVKDGMMQELKNLFD